MESNQLSIVEHEENLFIAPVVNLQVALQRYKDLKEFIKSILQENIDFGIIPGTTKKTLLKPGAEKLATFLGLSIEFQIVKEIEDWTGKDHEGESFFYYWYKCKVFRNGKLITEGEGSANSFEKKYRYRSTSVKCPHCGEESIIKSKAEFGGGWFCYPKKGGCGHRFKAGDPSIEN